MSNRVDLIALKAAESVEDEFAKGHVGGVTQRRASVQVIIAEAIKEAFESATAGLLQAKAER